MKTKKRGRKPARKGPRPQQAGRDPLQQATRPGSEETIDDEGSGDVEDAAREAAP